MKWVCRQIVRVGALLAAAAVAWADAPAVPAPEQCPEAQLVVAQNVPLRRLKGDWETPSYVLVADAAGWPQAAVELAREAAQTSDVVFLYDSEDTASGLTERLEAVGNTPHEIQPLAAPTDTPWVRDYGPLQTTMPGGRIIWLDANYDSERKADDAIPLMLASEFGVPLEALPETLHGGAIVSNGRGFCLSTLDYFDWAAIDVEDDERRENLLTTLGCPVLLLVSSLQDEPTRHADLFVQFLGPDLVALAEPDAETQPQNACRMQAAKAGIRKAAAYLGQPMRILDVPLVSGEPGVYYSHLNALRVGPHLLVPRYEAVDDQVQNENYRLLAEALPGVEIVPIAADDFIESEGAIHCLALGLFGIPATPPPPAPVTAKPPAKPTTVNEQAPARNRRL